MRRDCRRSGGRVWRGASPEFECTLSWKYCTSLQSTTTAASRSQTSGNDVLLELIRTLWRRCRPYKIVGARETLEHGDASVLSRFQQQLIDAAAEHAGEAAVTEVGGGWVRKGLDAYVGASVEERMESGWKGKDSAVYLLTAVATRGATAAVRGGVF